MADFATPEGTKNYADRMWAENPHISPDSWRMLEGLTVSKVGVGTYRMDGREMQPQALEKALISGLNLIDTSANYMDGGAEIFIGQTLKKLFEQQKLKREEVVLVSKAGYMQGQTLQAWQKTPPPEAVVCSEAMWHCIHPDFLHSEFENTQKRLGRTGVDVFLLHNPEYYLIQAVEAATPLGRAQAEFYRRVQKAFEFLETLCQQGKLQYYGVSANTLVSAPEMPDHVDLARVFEAAQAAAQTVWGRRKRPLFRVVQMPYNLVETGAITCKNTEAKTFSGHEHVSTLELATRMHLSVLVNRPLNAFSPEGKAYRLAEGAEAPDLAPLVQTLEDAEKTLPTIADVPRLSALAPKLSEQMLNSLHFDHLKTTALTPLLMQTVAEGGGNKAQNTAFVQAYTAVVRGLHAQAQHKDSLAHATLKASVYKRLSSQAQKLPFQQVALNALASTPGVTSVLCGVRQPDYVDDAVKVLEMGDFSDVGAVFAA